MININVTLLILPYDYQWESSPVGTLYFSLLGTTVAEGTWPWAVSVTFRVCSHYKGSCAKTVCLIGQPNSRKFS